MKIDLKSMIAMIGGSVTRNFKHYLVAFSLLFFISLVASCNASGKYQEAPSQSQPQPKEVKVVTPSKTLPVMIGQPFPHLEVITTHGKIVLPDHFTKQGKWFVLFSHPADFTPVCTTEFYSFQKHYPEFRNLNTELIGLSIDQVFSHIKWTEWIEKTLKTKIEFPIIDDAVLKVSKALGLIHRSGTNTVRGVFIVDPKGIIRFMAYYPQSTGRNIKEILRVIKALQTVDKYKVATPANWPNNELVKDEVIIPPANTVKKAEENAKKYKCFDWWFCHKKIK